MTTLSSAAPTAVLSFLGTPRLWRDGSDRPLDLRYRRGNGVLAFLLAHAGTPVSRDALGELFWPSLDRAAARNNLRVVLFDLVARLKDLDLPGLVEAQRDWLMARAGDGAMLDLNYLDPAQPWASAARAHPLARQAAQAADAWLPGIWTDASGDFADWLTSQRARLDRAEPMPEPLIAPLLAPREPSAAQESSGRRRLDRAPAEMAVLSLLRVELPSGEPITPWLDALTREVEAFGGRRISTDARGALFAFGVRRTQAGQRWQTLRAALHAWNGALLPPTARLAASAGRVLVISAPSRDTAPVVLGRRLHLLDDLLRHAAPGELACCDSMAEYAAHFGIAPLWKLRASGFDEDITLHKLHLADGREPLIAPIGGRESAFAGRDGEEALAERLLAASQSGLATGLCLRAESGMGKTRLAWEIASRCQQGGGRVFWIGARPETQGAPWRCLREFLAALLQGAGSLADRLARLSAQLSVSWSARQLRALEAVASGHGLPSESRGVLVEALVAMFESGADLRHLCVVDDVQWIDPASADILLRVARGARHALWLLTMRAGHDNPLAAIATSLASYQTLDLPPLDDASARRIVDSLPEAASLDEAQIRGRVANARGVPLYLVADLPYVGEDNPRFQESCEAMFHRMGQGRQVLRAASVLGMLFDESSLNALYPEAEVSGALERALSAGLVFSRGPGRMAFFHPRLREHVLGTLPPRELAATASACAQVMHARGDWSAAAALWERAGRVESAKEAWHAAGLAAIEARDMFAGCHAYDHLAALGYLNGAGHAASLLQHARCLLARDGFGARRANPVIARLTELLPQLLEDEQQLAFDALAVVYLHTSGLDHARALDDAARLQAQARAGAQQLFAAWARTSALLGLGRLSEAAAACAEAQALAERLPQDERMRYFPSDVAVLLGCQDAWLRWLVGDAAGLAAQRALVRRRADESPAAHDAVVTLCCAALFEWATQAAPPGAPTARQAAALAQSEGFEYWQLLATQLDESTPADAAVLRERAEAIGQCHGVSRALAAWVACDRLLRAGQTQAALAWIDELLTGDLAPQARGLRMDLLRLRALALPPAEQAAALDLARQAGEAMGATGWLRHHGWTASKA